MKKFKKLAALLLALTMVFALAACGTDGDNNSQAPSDNPPASEPANPDDSNSSRACSRRVTFRPTRTV